MSSSLPALNNGSGSIVVDGSGANNLTISGNNTRRVFFVYAGNVTISNLNVANGLAKGGNGGADPLNGGGGGLGAGGALFVNQGANVTVQDVTFNGNSAVGGAGGTLSGGGVAGGAGGGGLGGNGGSQGGGGGGGLIGNGNNGLAFTGGAGAPPGGDQLSPGIAGGSFGGGGGGGTQANGGAGGEFGGGGGAGTDALGGAGNGGFGGGGGGAVNSAAGTGGFGAGNGGSTAAGDGGSGFGGAVFVRQGGTFNIQNSTTSTSAVTAGASGGGASTAGQAAGQDLYLMTGVNANFGGTTSNLSGSISGAGSVTIGSSGTTTLTGANNYTGGTTVSSGTLSGNTSSLQGAITNNSAVLFNQSSGGTYAGNMTGSGSLAKQGVGNLILSGANNYSGGTTVSAGTLTGTTTSLQGHITNDAAVVFNQATDGTYSGNMTGSGTLIKQGAGNLVLTGANNYGSGTAVNAGTLTGDSTSLHGYFYSEGSIVFNQSTDGTFAGELYGTGTVRKTGTGSLTFSNTSIYSGPTKIEAGRLAVDAELASNIEVYPGATLGGNGLVTGDVVNNGTLAAGNSIGTLSINGNYTASPGSTTHVEINDGGTTPGVNNDLVVIDGFPPISGVATLNGGTVTYSAAPGTYTVGSKYIFLEARSIVGTYAGATNVGPSNLRAMLGYGTINISGVDWMTVYLMLLNSQSNFAANAQTFNQYGVANYIDLSSTDPTPEMQALIDTLDSLSVPQQLAAFDSMTAQVNGTMAQLQVQDTTFLYMMLRRRVGSAYAASGMSGGGGFASYGSSGGYASAPSSSGLAARGSGGATVIPASYQSSSSTKVWLTPTATRRRYQPSWSGWVAGYGFGGNAQTDGNAAGGTYGSAGTIVALERPLDNEHLIGVFGAYSNLGLRLSGLPQSATANQGLFGGYFLRDVGSMYLLAAASAGFTGYRETRQMTFGDVNSTARGDYDGWSPSAYLEHGHRYQFGRTIVQPYGALQYIYVRQNAFTETGAGTLNQSVGGIDTNALRGLLGSRFAQVWTTRGGAPILPELRAAWMHEFLEPNSTLNATFAPVSGSSFAARGLNFGRDWAVLGTGLQYVMSRNVSLFANYDLLFNANQAWNAGSGGLQFVW